MLPTTFYGNQYSQPLIIPNASCDAQSDHHQDDEPTTQTTKGLASDRWITRMWCHSEMTTKKGVGF